MGKFDVKNEKRMISDIMVLLVTHYGGGLSEERLDKELATVQQAYDQARSSHAGQLRKSGEPYIFHPLRVTHLAARHWMDFPSVIAALLHDVVEDTPVTLSEIRTTYGEEVALLVDGLTKVTASELNNRNDLDRQELKEATYKKTVLAAIEDIRVLCLKFWDRIDNLMTIDALSEEKQKLIAEETRAIYVPLAQHLGMGYVAIELDSLSLQLIHPSQAERYRQQVDKIRTQNSVYLRKVRAKIINACEQHRLDVSLKDRWRPFSLAGVRDMQRGFVSLYTLEVQVYRNQDAYMFLGLLHQMFPSIPGKLRDHLNVSSRYGYQALKTTVQVGEQRMRVEITTRKLARFNDSGVLAPGFEFKWDNFRDLMRSLMEGESAFDTASLKLASATIQVYTPRGDVRILPEGSSVLDFAFDIHESLGLNARRGRINGRTRLLKSRLLDGDQVEVETAERPEVLPKWLEWAVTPKARNTIRRYLRNKVRTA